jgi:hypothetical protein
MKPYCFLDVDGVVNTVQQNAATGLSFVADNGFTIHVSKTLKADVERLADHFDMAWLTTWEHAANKMILPMIGNYEPWPVVEWTGKHRDETFRERYKLTAINKFFDEHGARPWCFIDDDAPWEIDALNQRDWFIHEKIPGPYLLLHPQIYVGLTTEETDRAIEFAEENVQ